MDKIKDELRARVPTSVLNDLDAYVYKHVPPGGFLEAVLSNNLKESFGRADNNNIRAMFDIVCYIYNCVPLTCWGSYELVKSWYTPKHGAVCSKCGRAVSVFEHSTGRATCCRADVVAEEEYK